MFSLAIINFHGNPAAIGYKEKYCYDFPIYRQSFDGVSPRYFIKTRFDREYTSSAEILRLMETIHFLINKKKLRVNVILQFSIHFSLFKMC